MTVRAQSEKLWVDYEGLKFYVRKTVIIQYRIIPIRFSPQAPFHALFITVPIGLCSNKNVLGHNLVAPLVETYVYNRNTSSHFPKLFPFLFFCPPCWIFTRVTAVHSFPDSRSRFPVPRSTLPVLVTSFGEALNEATRLVGNVLLQSGIVSLEVYSQ